MSDVELAYTVGQTLEVTAIDVAQGGWCVARPEGLPVLFVSALRGNDFVWRGNEMQVERMQPRRMIARVRPRVREFATGSRRRLRSLRERMSS